jgi:hypothetical protein
MEFATKTVGQNDSPSLTDFDNVKSHATIYFYFPGRHWLLATCFASATLFLVNFVLMGFFLFKLLWA